MDVWFEEMDLASFQERVRLPPDLEEEEEGLALQEEWCRQVKISFTPAFFLNGYEFPLRPYSLSDFSLLIPALTESLAAMPQAATYHIL